jgi:hypothetical protein
MINNSMNKYLRWYNKLIETRTDRVIPKGIYSEKHHITPKSLGGNDSPENLIDLLPREHFVAHLLLARIYCGSAGMKMVYALRRMLTGHKDYRYIPNSRTYEIIRKLSMEKCSGENNPMFGRTGENHPSYEKKEQIYNQEFKEKISQTSKGRKWTEEQREKRKASQTAYWANPENRKRQSEKIKQVEKTPEWRQKISDGQRGRVHSPETREKISVAKKQRPIG